MEGFAAALTVSFGVIAVAELGDKSQLMAMTFATRYRARTVLAGIAIATALAHLISVAIGLCLGTVLPAGPISVLAGLAFFGFAVWILRGDTLTEEETTRVRCGGTSALWAVGGAFFLAELGDKTMLATITLATTYGWFGTWVGSTIGMVAADALAIGVGRWLGGHLPDRAVRYGAAALFAVFGGWLVIGGLGQLI